MSGTNRNRKLITGGPAIILVEPQLGENIGMVARAMANFGLSELRLVNPRDGWPSTSARKAASRADHVIDETRVFPNLKEAIADLNHVMATTARQRDMLKTVLAPDEAASLAANRMQSGSSVGILFGRERWGLENHEIALADEIVTFPVNPAFASLNIAQAVLLMSYEWMRSSTDEGETGFRAPPSAPAPRNVLNELLKHLEQALDDAHYFYPPERRERMLLNLHNTFVHASLNEQEIHLLHGVIAALERRWLKKQTDKGANSETP
ncbi:MAG: RNA methyltransferase [Pseudomonadota bacterium]